MEHLYQCKETKIKVLVNEESIYDFLCQANHICIEFLNDCEFYSKERITITFHKSDCCVLRFGGDNYIEKGDILEITGIELVTQDSEKSGTYQTCYISCDNNIYNDTKSFGSYYLPHIQRSKENDIKITGKVNEQPQYGAQTGHILFPIKLKSNLTVNFKRSNLNLTEGTIILIESVNSCYVRKGDVIKTIKSRLLCYTDRFTNKRSFMLRIKKFYNDTLKFPSMEC